MKSVILFFSLPCARVAGTPIDRVLDAAVATKGAMEDAKTQLEHVWQRVDGLDLPGLMDWIKQSAKLTKESEKIGKAKKKADQLVKDLKDEGVHVPEAWSAINLMTGKLADITGNIQTADENIQKIAEDGDCREIIKDAETECQNMDWPMTGFKCITLVKNWVSDCREDMEAAKEDFKKAIEAAKKDCNMAIEEADKAIQTLKSDSTPESDLLAPSPAPLSPTPGPPTPPAPTSPPLPGPRSTPRGKNKGGGGGGGKESNIGTIVGILLAIIVTVIGAITMCCKRCKQSRAPADAGHDGIQLAERPHRRRAIQ